MFSMTLFFINQCCCLSIVSCLVLEEKKSRERENGLFLVQIVKPFPRRFFLNSDDVNLNSSVGCYEAVVFVLSILDQTSREERKKKNACFLFFFLLLPRERKKPKKKTFGDASREYKTNLRAIFRRMGATRSRA